jgi:uncharacterized RDD family membrane protein YckC
MACPVCGKTSACVHTLAGRSARNTRGLAAHLNSSALIDHNGDNEIVTGTARAGAGGRPSVEAWRQEVASRVQQHRARRRRPADPNAMELDFSAEPHSFTAGPDHSMPPPPERFAEIMVSQEPLKVIRFPRPQVASVPTVEEVRLDELQPAEPSPVTPRIFEVEPEVEPEVDPEAVEFGPSEPLPVRPAAAVSQQLDLLPSFADIRLEPEETRIDADLEIIPRPAPLAQRVVSGLVDAGLVVIATGACAFTFLKLAEEAPQSRMALLCVLAAGVIFWLLFEYMFLVYRRATPGMRVAQLELCTFTGEPTSVFNRQCRAWASTLSALSLGLGYAWALVDEDRLGWHDRISQTYVRSSTQPSAVSTQPWNSEV